MNNISNTSFVAWLAFVVAVAALIIGWLAFNRTGADLEDRIADGIRAAGQEVSQEFDGSSSNDDIR